MIEGSVQLSQLPPKSPSYRCVKCSCDLTLQDELVSRSFNGSHGTAYLFRTVWVISRVIREDKCTELRLDRINVVVGPSTRKQLLTGMHTIASECRAV
jgi:hypothetical protein